MKRLIVCFDGTWNTPTRKNRLTNVVGLMRAIPARTDKGVDQLTFYDAGVGTGDLIDRIKGGMFGAGLNENVQDGYRWLAHNYFPGDEVYVFGYSRGAFTARRLAGFIGWSKGLLRKAALDNLPELYKRYRQDDAKVGPGDLLANPVPVEKIDCVGVWDTVGALGVPTSLFRYFNASRYQFRDRQLGGFVRNGFHAIAIDERRGPFEPTLWEAPADEALPPGQTIEQAWFPGVHSSIGGGSEQRELSNIALFWMAERVGACTGLEFDATALHRLQFERDAAVDFADSRQGPVKLWAPLVRTIAGAPFDRPRHLLVFKSRTNEPNKGCRYVNEKLHPSVIDRLATVDGYAPVNLMAAINTRDDDVFT